MGRTQYAVDGPRGTFLVTRKNDRELWSVWRSDSLNTAARMANTVRAIERAAELSGVEPTAEAADDSTHDIGMISTGIAVLHRPSGKEFGLCHEHEGALDDADGIVTMGPLFGDFRCIVCNYVDTSDDQASSADDENNEPADLGYGDEAYTAATLDDIAESRRQGVKVPDDAADATAARTGPAHLELFGLPTAVHRYELESVSVLANGYTAFDLADHLADVMPKVIDDRRIWDMDPLELALLAVDHYPGGAVGLQLALEG
ncbi:hypothetical protein BRW64_00875 [Mycolicibacterium diernhoferi]|uniref:Uncharacterized protein n=2 Tax=Mycolicibacterium diernhoferi TaxID=1801 RepID=A0A1Q4HLB3_9MYCO|nr:hypothetical protein BRW64_00875 [Mycolicibacterium diernhoferi]OPE55752.1 hypothetical protein BV510_03405 [Mycolicibacterium diernhoferi]PEG56259.1 hypothetical protein CRI78_02515 [Mycolicibacterium diernhoferi]